MRLLVLFFLSILFLSVILSTILHCSVLIFSPSSSITPVSLNRSSVLLNW